MTVSVVIPCYNQGHFLREAVSSATARHCTVEIIVVDDGSTDSTPAVLRNLGGVVAIRQENQGLAAARNRGLARATGEFVIFLDADDRLLPDAIDVAGRALAARPSCAMAYGRCLMMGPDGAPWATPEQPAVRSGHFAALLRTNLIWMPAMAIFRREALETIGGFAPGFDAAADYDLYLRVAREYPIVDHERIVAGYRRHTASMSGNAARMLRETLEVMRRNHPGLDGDLAAAWADGYAGWQDFYGTQLVEEMRGDLSARALRSLAWKAIALARLAPAVFSREARRKLRVVYAGRAMPEAEISSASRRAEL